MKHVLISAVAKKILSRSDLAQLILHQHYELHTGLIFVTQNEISKFLLKKRLKLQNYFYPMRPGLRISLLDDV